MILCASLTDRVRRNKGDNVPTILLSGGELCTGVIAYCSMSYRPLIDKVLERMERNKTLKPDGHRNFGGGRDCEDTEVKAQCRLEMLSCTGSHVVGTALSSGGQSSKLATIG